ncbi:MAG: PHP domain-containing protein [candidate division KSB1 bacterium]|nr:PHP domain-containing protein [candidate division KSB1 bacterium]
MKRKIIADLHNHTTASDGEYSPTGLVEKAKELELVAIGVTDHDTIEGVPEAIQAGERLNVQVVPGVEVSLAFRRPYFVGTLHLLLYFSKAFLNDEKFTNWLTEILSQGRGLSLIQARVNAINEEFGPAGHYPLLRRPLEVDELTSYSPNVTRRHFALALSEKHGIQQKEQINQIIGNNSPAYIPSGIDISKITPFLAKYPVFRVLAHPAAGSFPAETQYKEVNPPIEIVEKILPEFLDPRVVGIDGIEVFYPGHTHEHRLLLLQWAETFRLVTTGGSDCHDPIHRPLGIDGLTREELEVVLTKLNHQVA